LQFPQVKKDISLTPQLIRDHCRLRRDRRNNGHPDAAPLHPFYLVL
jgi:hypothetical protein